MKFRDGMQVRASRLLSSHLFSGFKVGKIYKCSILTVSSHQGPAGIWIYSKNTGIRLQDLNGNLTGHGSYFEPVPAQIDAFGQLIRPQSEDESDDNGDDDETENDYPPR